MYALCVGKKRNAKSVIVEYELMLESGETITKEAKQLKEEIRAGKIIVCDLKLTSDGRLVDSCLQGIPEEGTKLFEEMIRSGKIIREYVDSSECFEFSEYLEPEATVVYSDFKIFTGEELKNLLDKTVNKYSERRNFVKKIVEYMGEDRFDEALLVSGLKGTGKTTGVLQALHEYCGGDYNKTAYVAINQSSTFDWFELTKILESMFSWGTFIVLDGASVLKIYNRGRSILYHYPLFNWIIVSGTDSLTIDLASGSSLFGRSSLMDTTFIQFEEAKRISNMTYREYLKSGGMFKSDRIQDTKSLVRYVDTAIVDNIYNTKKRNTDDWRLLYRLDGLNKRQLRFLVYKIIYSIALERILMSKGKGHIRFIKDMLYNTYIEPQGYDYIVNKAVCGILKMKSCPFAFTFDHAMGILLALIKMNFIMEVENIYASWDGIRYYIRNTAIVRVVTADIIKAIERFDPKLKENIDLTAEAAATAECSIMCHLHQFCEDPSSLYKVEYLYRDEGKEGEKEVFALVFKEKDKCNDVYTDAHLYGFALTSDYREAALKTSWIAKVNDQRFHKDISCWEWSCDKYFECELQGCPCNEMQRSITNGIICEADNDTVFNSLSDSELKQVRDNMRRNGEAEITVKSAAANNKTNDGTLIISAEKFVLDPEHYLNI